MDYKDYRREMPLLSVIVPCYNMEKYVDHCLESLTAQVYENIEIVCVDDGSIDGTPTMLDAWAKKDSRIRPIHQVNKGSSLARHTGLQAIRGGYLTFVDADDYVHPRIYELMMQAMLEEEADIAQCGVCDARTDSDGHKVERHRVTDTISGNHTAYGHVEAVEKILHDHEWRSYMYNKVYRKEMFEGVIFPEGRGLDEDLSIMHQIFHNANKTVYLDSEFYYYVARPDSICHDETFEACVKKSIDRSEARWERYLFTKTHIEYHAMLTEMENVYVSIALANLRFYYKHKEAYPQGFAEKMRRRIMSIHLPLHKQMPEQISKMKTVELFLFRHCFPLYRFFVKKIL